MKFYAHQKEAIADRSMLRLFLKARGTGFSTVLSADHAAECAGLELATGHYDPSSGCDQLLVSTGENQSLELIRMMLRHLEAFGAALGVPLVEGASQSEIRLRNGKRIISIAGGNPRAARGYTGSVFLDEAAHIRNVRELFAALFPVTQRFTIRPQGFRFSMASTPNGPSGLFYELAETAAGDRWSIHRTTIDDAVACGFPIDPEAVRASFGDDESAYRQEYLCSFEDLSGALISAETFDACVIDREDMPDDPGNGVAGFDPARTRDAIACVDGFDADGTLWIVGCETTVGASFSAQRDWLRRVYQRRQTIGVDATGLGSNLAEDMAKECPGIQALNLSSGTIRDDALNELSHRIATGTIRIARDLKGLRRATLSVRKQVSETGRVLLRLPRTKDGHADEAMALALACYVARRTGQDWSTWLPVTSSRPRRDRASDLFATDRRDGPRALGQSERERDFHTAPTYSPKRGKHYIF